MNNDINCTGVVELLKNKFDNDEENYGCKRLKEALDVFLIYGSDLFQVRETAYKL